MIFEDFYLYFYIFIRKKNHEISLSTNFVIYYILLLQEKIFSSQTHVNDNQYKHIRAH